MAAGLGFKTFTTGEVLTAADVNGYLMQGVLVFASEAARNAAITSPQEGQFAFTKDTNSLWYYSGSAWVASGATGDIEGVTAGTGISGGGTSGTVTITNSMATEITAKADLIVGTGNATFDNLAVGANGTVLTADSTVSPTGLKWATAASGGMTELASGSLSGSTLTLSSISASYKNLQLIIRDVYTSADTPLNVRVNNDTGSNYRYTGTLNIASGGGPNLAIGTEGTSWEITNTSLDNVDNNNAVQVNIFDYANATSQKLGSALTTFTSSGNGKAMTNVALGYYPVTAIDRIDFFPGSGTFSGGTYVLYGVK